MTGNHFEVYLELYEKLETRLQLQAIAHMQGDKGMYSRPAKRFISEGIERFLAGLTPKQRREYDEILENVRIKHVMKPVGMAKHAYVRKKDRRAREQEQAEEEEIKPVVDVPEEPGVSV